MDIGGTSPRKGVGRTMQEAIVESNAGAIAEGMDSPSNLSFS